MATPHRHKLTLLQVPPYEPHRRFICNLCREVGNGPTYHCGHCHFDAHPECIASSEVLDHMSHSEHSLDRGRISDNHHLCDSCGLKVYGISYRCRACDFDIHPTCARAPRLLLHSQHKHHPLALTRFASGSTLRCSACKQYLHHQCYACTVCPDYHLHQFCATVCSRIRHPDHPRHELRLVATAAQDRVCDRCRLGVLGWHFQCHVCDSFSLHPQCTNIVHEIPVQSPPSSASTTASSSSRASSSSSLASSSSSHASSSSLASSTCHGPILAHGDNLLLQALQHVPTDGDIRAAENVLRFARSLLASMSSIGNSAASTSTHQTPPRADDGDEADDVCPTCLEGFSEQKPKKSTNCGHHFHLDCLLEWMDRSQQCPICRSDVRIML